MTSNEIIFRHQSGHFAIQNFFFFSQENFFFIFFQRWETDIQLLEYAVDFSIIRSGGTVIGIFWFHFDQAGMLAWFY